MPTYIVVHSPNRPVKISENPAKEIVDRIKRKECATTEFGGWSICENAEEIEPESRLLFFRSRHGFFAVGRVLPADDCKCREVRRAGLQKRFPNNPNADKLDDPISPGLAAYKALDWNAGEGKTTHINAVWDIVAAPMGVLLECSMTDKKMGLPLQECGSDPSGIRIPDDNVAEAICAKCKPEEPGVQLDSNPEWNVVGSKSGRVFIRRKLIGTCVD